MDKHEEFQNVFEKLMVLLKKYENHLNVVIDVSGNYYLNTPYVEKYKKEVFFGAVQIKKNYVSFHLFPVYVYPQLLEGMSKDLKKRMQGKSCFNFKSIDDTLFAELEGLTEKGYQKFKELRQS
jgi:hypothetical protein